MLLWHAAALGLFRLLTHTAAFPQQHSRSNMFQQATESTFSIQRHTTTPHSMRSGTLMHRSSKHFVSAATAIAASLKVSHARWPAAPAAACSSHPATAAGWPRLLPAQPSSRTSSNVHSKLSSKLPVTRAALHDALARKQTGHVTAAHQPTQLFLSRNGAAAPTGCEAQNHQ